MGIKVFPRSIVPAHFLSSAYLVTEKGPSGSWQSKEVTETVSERETRSRTSFEAAAAETSTLEDGGLIRGGPTSRRRRVE